MDSSTVLGPTRSIYFLSNEVIRGGVEDGFHRCERPMVAKAYTLDGMRYNEFPGYTCANRYHRVIYKHYYKYKRTALNPLCSSSKLRRLGCHTGMALDPVTSKSESTNCQPKHVYMFRELCGPTSEQLRSTRTRELEGFESATA